MQPNSTAKTGIQPLFNPLTRGGKTPRKKNMEKKKETRGGVRKNAGRPAIPVAERKVQIAFYVRKKNAVKLREKIKALLKKMDK